MFHVESVTRPLQPLLTARNNDFLTFNMFQQLIDINMAARKSWGDGGIRVITGDLTRDEREEVRGTTGKVRAGGERRTVAKGQ